MTPEELPLPTLAEESAAECAQPHVYSNFRCIGAACEDTCCEGWGVPVDRATYEKYQRCSDPQLGPKLRQLVTIKNADSIAAYASIHSPGGRCTFLADGLCSIQLKLGEDYLGHICATYPRILNKLGSHTERSLDLSCPEAARLTLLDEKPMQFGEGIPPQTAEGNVRTLIIHLLQNRSYPVAKRLLLVGKFCDAWSEFEMPTAPGDADLQPGSADASTQLTLVLELMVARLRLDYTTPRYLDLYREFAEGLQLKAESTREQIGLRYSEAYRRYYAPFMERHEHMLENYLVAYAFKTMFPFGSPSVRRTLHLEKPGGTSCVSQYMLMAAYFSISKAIMIGLAARYKTDFSPDHVVRAIQSISKTFEHCETCPARLLAILASKAISNCAAMAVLTENLR